MRNIGFSALSVLRERLSFTYAASMSGRVPSLNWLRVFEAAARTESFARAADQLNMSAAAVSQQVRALEERLGTPLFERRAQSVVLTEAGRSYLAPVQQSLMTLENATEGLFGEARAGQLYVQSVMLFAHGILAGNLHEFETAHPNVALTLATANSALEFSQGFADLKIIFGSPQPFGRFSDGLIGERLYPVALPEVAATIRQPADLLAHRLVEVSTHRASWPHFFESAGVIAGRARYLFTDSTLMAFSVASQGHGIALARAPASDKAMRDAGLVACQPDLWAEGTTGYHLVYDDPGGLRSPARAFRTWLLDHMAGLRTR